MYLPRPTDPVVVPAKAGGSPEPPRRGTETILLVEDDLAVRAIVNRALTNAGYTVLKAPRGREALELARNHPGPIDLLVTDVVMPVISGPELAARLAEARPGLPVLYISGYPRAILEGEFLQGGAHYLAKPFAPGALQRRGGAGRRRSKGTGCAIPNE